MDKMANQRFGVYLKTKKISQTMLAELLQTSQPTLSAILSGKRSLSRGMAARIGETFPNLNIDWLMTGEGEMIRPGFKNEVTDLTEKEEAYIREGLSNGTLEMVPIHRISDKSFRLVPLINIDSVGGVHSENFTTESEQYVIRMMPFTEARDGDVAIFQSGNSMYPTIPPGSILLIREVPDWREYFGYGNIYVLWLRDGRRITKEIRRYDADSQNYVWCVSYNPDVADEELPKSMIRGVWKVIKYQADFGW